MNKDRSLLNGLIFGLWGLGSAALIWWFQLGQLETFSDDADLVFFEGARFKEALQNVATQPTSHASGTVKVLHFRDPDCRCVQESDEHLTEIIKTYTGKNVSFQVINKPGHLATHSTLHHPDVINQAITSSSLLAKLPSSPAVAILDQSNELVYFGPYSFGTLCNGTDRFVESTLDNILGSNTANTKRQNIQNTQNTPNTQNINTVGLGCFCDWQTEGNNLRQEVAIQ